MKLSKYQRLLLENLEEDYVWQFKDCNYHEKRSLWIMQDSGLVDVSNHENPICSITEKGKELI